MIDALLGRGRQQGRWNAGLRDESRWPHLPLPTGRGILVTAHRRESFGQPLADICRALRAGRARRGDRVHIVYPVHRNPNVWDRCTRCWTACPASRSCRPVDYRPLVHLMKRCKLILTDSGGIQEEAPSLDVPVLVLRETTERPEAVEAGASRVVGTEPGVDHRGRP